MNLQFIDIKSKHREPLATIHITGKLGFNYPSILFMDLNKDLYFKVGVDKNNKDCIFLVPSDKLEENSIKVCKAGIYYYLNVVSIWSKINLDYKKESISFKIQKEDYQGKSIFKLSINEKTKRNN